MLVIIVSRGFSRIPAGPTGHALQAPSRQVLSARLASGDLQVAKVPAGLAGCVRGLRG